MASVPTVQIVETTRVAPTDSPKPPTEFSLPLTFFDTIWFKFHPVERIFFYSLDNNSSSPECFYSEIVPKLKRSLSLALVHFLPLAGNLRWPSGSPKPIIIYCPDDGVSLTVAESNSNFRLLSGDEVHRAADLHPFVPHLTVTHDAAAVISLQITLFPFQGFSIGITAHHSVLDGKSSTMFFKAWAHLCKQSAARNSSLPPALTPFYDRNVVSDPKRLDLLYLKQWLDFTTSDSDPNRRSLMIVENIRDDSDDLVRATFNLTREDINKLREKVLSMVDSTKKQLHLSSFVLTLAYVSTCQVKARGDEIGNDRNVIFAFSVDCRKRKLNPPIPENYFGNCVSAENITSVKARSFIEKNGLAFAAELASDMITEMERKGILHEAEHSLTKCLDAIKQSGVQLISVAGSPRLGVYEADFGWGKPRKVEIVSIDRGGATALAENRDGNGGIEIGVVLKKHEMKTFASLFLDGLKDH